MKQKISLTSILVYGLLVTFFALALWLLVRTKPIKVEIASVKVGDFQELLRVDGTIRSKNKMTVVARASGDLDRVDLKAGQNVSKGEILTHLKWDVHEAIKSPMAGVIAKVYRESAGPINRGDPIVDLIDPENLEIESEVLTTDAVKIKIGDAVKISGLGNESALDGSVYRISRAGFTKLSALGIEEEKTLVYVQFNQPPKDKLGDTFHVELSIELSKIANALKIPLGALFKDKQQWAVYKVLQNRAHLTHVNIGKRNEAEAVVTSGLQEKDQIILFPGDQISEGTEIRSQKEP